MERKSNHFSGQLGFVLAAAGSAVGVGNLWRFPYLAAKDGGGLFLIIYFVLVLHSDLHFLPPTSPLDAVLRKVQSELTPKCIPNGSFWESLHFWYRSLS